MANNNFETVKVLPHVDCPEEDFYELCRTLKPTSALVDGTSLKINSSGQIVAGDNTAHFRRYSKTFADLAQSAPGFDVELFQLPAGGVIHAIKLKHSEAFSGGGLSAYTLSIGIASNLTKYMPPQSVFSLPGATNLHIVWGPFLNFALPPVFVNIDNAIGGLTIAGTYTQAQITALRDACETLADDCRAMRAALANYCGGTVGHESDTAPQSIRLAAVATGGNTSAATSGKVDVWVLYSILQPPV